MNDESQGAEQGGTEDGGTGQSGTEQGAGDDRAAERSSTSVALSGISEHALVMTPLRGLVLALLAGLAVWGTLEAILPVFRLPVHLQELGGNAPAAEHQELRAAVKETRDWNAVLSLVLLASTLALVLTSTELLQRRAGSRIVWGALLACLVAGIIAIGAGAAAVGLHDVLRLDGNRLGKTIVVQGAMLGLTGLGIGLAIGMPLLRPRLLVTCVAGCLIGGMLAALVFPIAASTCLPNVNTDHLVPQPGLGLLLWVVLATGLIGTTVTGLGKDKKKERAAAADVTGRT